MVFIIKRVNNDFLAKKWSNHMSVIGLRKIGIYKKYRYKFNSNQEFLSAESFALG